MGEKDVTEKILEAHNDVFADIMNVLMFDGEEVVKPEDLTDQTTHSVYKADGKVRELERDVAKRWNKSNIRIACIGLENQTADDRDMPLRIMGYDGAEYKAETLAGKDRYPVITLVLYFGYKKHWTAPKSLSECMEIPARCRPFFHDYAINVMEIAYLTPEQVKLFKSDFRIVADYFVQMRMNNDYKPDPINMKHVHEVLQLMSVLTKDNRYAEAVSKKISEKGEPKNMCEVLDRLIGEGEGRGEARGEARGESKGRLMSAVKTIKRYLKRSLPLTDDVIADIADDNDLSAEKVRELIEKERLSLS